MHLRIITDLLFSNGQPEGAIIEQRHERGRCEGRGLMNWMRRWESLFLGFIPSYQKKDNIFMQIHLLNVQSTVDTII